DHDAEIVEAPGYRRIIAPEVLALVGAHEVRRGQGFEADEDAAQPRGRGPRAEVPLADRVDGGGALEQPPHAAHAVEERRGEAAIAEQVIVEKVQMAPRQPGDLGERVVDPLGRETAT